MNQVILNLIRVGKVSSINDSKGTVKVIFEDKDRMISDDLPMLNFEYRMPRIGQQVLCVFLPNGKNQGFCLGGFFSEVDPPLVADRNIFCKTFNDGTSIKYDKLNKNLFIEGAGDIIITAKGNISIQSDGDIETIAGGSNTDRANLKTVPVIHH